MSTMSTGDLFIWPADPEATFREMHDDFGMSVPAIASALGLPEGAVHDACVSFGIITLPVDTETPPAKQKAAPERNQKTKPAGRVLKLKVDLDPVTGIPVFDLGPREPRGCRYVIGDVRKGSWRYCQEAQVEGSSYCAEHHAACHSRATDPEKEAIAA